MKSYTIRFGRVLKKSGSIYYNAILKLKESVEIGRQ